MYSDFSGQQHHWIDKLILISLGSRSTTTALLSSEIIHCIRERANIVDFAVDIYNGSILALVYDDGHSGFQCYTTTLGVY